jgi:AsmA protein
VTMEKIHIDAEATNKTGKLSDTEVDLHEMTYLLDDEPFRMKGSVHNFVNYEYDIDIDGLIDLEKIVKLYPIPGTTVTGTMDIDVESSGKLSTLKSMNFDSLKSSGTVEFKNIALTTKSMAQPLKISDAKMTFTPQKIVVEKFNGSVGNSDFSITGHLLDYHSWVFQTGRNIKGDLTLTSDTLDYNAMFPSPATSHAVAKDTSKSASPAVVSIPGQIDFTFDAKVGYIRFDQMKIKDFAGEIRIKDGVMSLNETGFTSEDADFKINGTYDTRDIKHPLFDLVMDIDKLDFNKAFSMFETVKNAAPAAKNTDGVFSTKYHLKGELSPEFSPLLETLEGGGTIIIQDAQVKGMKMFSNVSGITKKQELADPHLKDITMETEIKGGKIYIKPFSFQIGKYFTELEGSQSFDNKMDYVLKLSAPAFHKIKIPFRISGTTDKPIVKVGKGHEKFDFTDF